MKNKMSDLNNHLFAALERLSDDGMTAEQLEAEVSRSEAIVQVADRITATATLQLNAARLFAQHGTQVLPMLPQIGGAVKTVTEAKDDAQ